MLFSEQNVAGYGVATDEDSRAPILCPTERKLVLSNFTKELSYLTKKPEMLKNQ
jgi:hypothetical protein